ncbi:type IV toxin-antitoxin system AbiEi family antitoxin domain-containing protein [Pseudonocardia sp. C8]|uniref:type IV toxin-antitoxin system AbiEi family antitoxin domain-containing protein n=1 Tax=Pseudonocardia sp. C8 TaxID=2762759 RepID=UPI0016430E0C|nr:type IV toxin-antitoxin system AbiEi family antitoxin domain-containing protein [Pseudonocardia sp. C8]MBC3190164.1 type IV toxin-antitoxin system AbiEi family antitoxin domain-containing protein [Pseudonocardia sp. C8]
MTRTATPPAPTALDALIAAQGGLVTRSQATRLGLSPDAIDRLLAARRWVPAHPRVHRDVRYPATEETRVRAAVLWAGAGAVLTGAAAAWWWGLLDTAPEVVTVTVPRRRAPRPRAGVQVRRRGLDPADVAEHAGLAVAAPALAVLESALDPDVAGEAYLARILVGAAGTAGAGRAGRIAAPPPDLAALAAARARNAGAHGSATTARMLTSAARQASTSAVHRLRALLVQERLPGWCSDHEVAGVVLRLAFPASRVAVEVRGDGPDPLARPGGPAWRHAVLRRQGWQVHTLEPADPWQRPEATLAGLRGALAGTGPAGRAAG